MDKKKNAGFVIIAVTVILVALSLMGMTFINLTSIDYNATNNYVNGLQVEMAAHAGLEYAIYVLKMDKYGTDSTVYNNNNYRYIGTETMGYDENHDAYTEEWLGPGRDTIFGSATANKNTVDNNGDGSNDSNWLDIPFSLDRKLRAQYAILIEDIGESRINVNATGNIVGTNSSFAYGTGATTYDIRLQDVFNSITIAKDVIVGTNTARCGPNGIPGNSGTMASQFLPRTCDSDDRPFNALDAADICFGTYTTNPSTYQSRLRKIINNETLFQNKRNFLTPYSFDTIITNDGIISLLLPDENNYYRLKLNSLTLAGSITAQLQKVGFSEGTATQLAVHIKDYIDTDNDITMYGTPTKYGLEAHPFINELYHNGTYSAYPCQHRIELYNPFNVTIGSSTMSINGSPMDLVLKVTKTQYYTTGSPGCNWLTGTVTIGTYTINTASLNMQPQDHVILGYDEPGNQGNLPSLSGTQTVTGFNIYDYDSDNIPQAVTITLMGSSSALGSGSYLILDEAEPEASYNKIRGEDVLYLLYQLIAYLYDKTHAPGNTQQETEAFQSLLNRSGEGEWDGVLGTVAYEHTSTQSGNNALNQLTTHVSAIGPNVYVVSWDPGASGIDNAISELNSLINATNNNQQIDDTVENKIIADTQEIIDILNKIKCNGSLNVRASTGERKNPLIEKSNNWGTATTSNHTLGLVNYQYNNVLPYNEKKQLKVANIEMISLGELGNLLTIGYGTQSPYTKDPIYNVTGSSTVDNAKLNLTSGTATLVSEYFTIIDPKDDTIDDDADGAIGTDTGNQLGDIDGPEIQIPGRININTATSTVLAALPGTCTNTSLGTWSTLTGNSLINNIINARPFTTIGALANVPGIDYFGTDNVDNDDDGFIDEKDEKDLIFTSISNLITTHTNVFAVYVTARIVNSNASRTFAEKKLVAIVDRSATPIKIRYFRWVTEW